MDSPQKVPRIHPSPTLRDAGRYSIQRKMLEKAKLAKRESKYVDFKERFDVESSGDWIELVKDIVAMANSGGGVILIGVRNNGMPSGFGVTPVLNIDPARFTDKIASFTGEQFSDFEIERMTRNGQEVAVLRVHGIAIPMVFLREGTYQITDSEQKRAFNKGTVYFRHGAKSEPGDSNDLRKVIEKELEKIRKSWIGSIRKIIQAPAGYDVHLVSDKAVESAVPGEIRVTYDPKAPGLRGIDRDVTHPYRLKEVVQIVNRRLGVKRKVVPYDVICVRRVHGTDAKRQYFYKRKFGSPQYSDAFADWLVGQHERNPSFFDKAREKSRSK